MTKLSKNNLSEQANGNLEQLYALLGRYCLSLTQSIWDGDDLVQDTWVKTLEKINEGKHSNPEALILRTAKNTWIDQVRRRKLFERIMDQEQEQVRITQECGDRISLDVEMAFYFLLTNLSPLQRTVLLLRSVLGYSVAETAIKLQTTEGAVKAAYHRARKELQHNKQELDEIENEPQSEEMKARLRALSTAYMEGEVDEVLRLVQDEQEMVSAVGAYSTHTQLAHFSFGYSENRINNRMSA